LWQVMSGAGAAAKAPSIRPDDRVGRFVVVRHPHTASGRDLLEPLDDPEHGEARSDRPAAVDRADRRHHGSHHPFVPELSLRDRAAADEPGDDAAQVGLEGDHLGTHPGFGGDPAGLDLGRPIDPEQLGVGPGEPKDEGLAVDLDPVVPVRDPRLDRHDGRCATGPHRHQRALEPRVVRHRGER
jgi:hypothetical protein